MDMGKLQITPLGGLGQFGMNITAFRYDGQMIIVDCGMMFPDEDLLGADIAIPDLTYIEDHRDEVIGIVLTHAHEDHVGRSEEHTSELQSRSDLVCRLLL